MIHLKNIVSPQMTQTNSQYKSQHQHHLSNLLREAKGLFRDLKEGIIA